MHWMCLCAADFHGSCLESTVPIRDSLWGKACVRVESLKLGVRGEEAAGGT